MAQTDNPDDSGKEPVPPPDNSRLTRRRLLTAGASLPLATAAAAAVIRGEMPWREGQAAVPSVVASGASVSAATDTTYVFFNSAESAFIEAAIARLIPDDELGPGALQAGVSFFIDRQLAGQYGQGTRWYMQGPWSKGEATQGYQARMPPAALYRAAVREIDEATTRDARSTFAKLAPPDQDAWLHRLEAGQVQLPTADAKTFFTLLWQNTQEGFWSDPVYGGNRGLVGWKLIGFPGARYDHSAFVSRHGEIYPLPPVGLKGRVEWLSKG